MGKLIFLECQRRDINTQLRQLVVLDTGAQSSHTQSEDVPWGTHLLTIHRAGGDRLAAKNHGAIHLNRGTFLLVGHSFFAQYKCIIDYLLRTFYFTLGHDTYSVPFHYLNVADVIAGITYLPPPFQPIQ